MAQLTADDCGRLASECYAEKPEIEEEHGSAQRRKGEKGNHLDDGEGEIVSLPVGDMDEARLVLTEELIRAVLRREKAAKKQRKARRVGPPAGDERGDLRRRKG